MDGKVINFKPKDKTAFEKLTEACGSKNYVAFWFDENSQLYYNFGEGMTNEQLAYLEKTISIITTDTFKETIIQTIE